jgi:hypothetical protein
MDFGHEANATLAVERPVLSHHQGEMLQRFTG